MEIKVTHPNITEDTMATVSAPDLGLDPQECVASGRIDPCTIVIMGATGVESTLYRVRRHTRHRTVGS